MSLVAIANGDAGLSVRTNLNALLMAKESIVGRRGCQSPLQYNSAASEIAKFDRQRIFGLTESGIRDIRIQVSNFSIAVGASEAVPAADMIYQGVIEPIWGGTQLYPIYFKGMDTVTIPKGGSVWSDPIGEFIPKGQDWGLRHYLQCATGLIPGGLASQSALGEGTTIYTTAPGSSPISGTAPTAANARIFSPSAITGFFTDSYVPTLLICGDSISEGTGDGPTQTNGFLGFVEKVVGAAGRPYVNQSRSGDSYRLRNRSHARRDSAVHVGYDRCICEIGINDINTDTSQAVVQAEMVNFWKARAARGAKVWQTTITPYNTTYNSKVVPNATLEGWRTTINDWIRDGAPISNGVAVATGTSSAIRMGQAGHPLYGYFEAADTVETARNSGIWQDLASSDGLHPTAAGTVKLMTCIDPNVLL